MKTAILSKPEYDPARAYATVSALESEMSELKTSNVVLEDELGSARREILIWKSTTRTWY